MEVLGQKSGGQNNSAHRAEKGDKNDEVSQNFIERCCDPEDRREEFSTFDLAGVFQVDEMTYYKMPRTDIEGSKVFCAWVEGIFAAMHAKPRGRENNFYSN